MDWGTLGLGLLVFLARLVDVSLGTVRTISIVNGRTGVAFALAVGEISIWLAVISTVVPRVAGEPLLGVFYAFGFASGNVLGVMVERRVALGATILRVISAKRGREMAGLIREKGYAVTTFQGEGLSGPVLELYIVCRRRDLRRIIPLVKEIDPEAFYLTEQAGSVSKIYRPMMQQATGWRAVFKKK